MKKVLIITYYWPPAGGPGVQRVLKFAKYLPEFGWQPIILTIKKGEYPATDETLAEDIPESCKVYKTNSIEPNFLYKKFTGMKLEEKIPVAVLAEENINWKKQLANWIRLNIFIPDAKIGWIPFAVNKGKEIIKKEKPDIIFSSSPPPTVHLIARKLAKWSGIKWVADFRDPWTKVYHYDKAKKSKFSKSYDKKLEKRIINTVDKVISVSNGVADLLKVRKNPKKPITVIPNGYDELDFCNFDKNQSFDKFTIAYAGKVNMQQNPTNLWKVLGTLTKTDQRFAQKFQILFMGNIAPEIINEIKENGIENNLKILGYVNHKNMLENLIKSHILLLLIPNTKNNEGIVTGKLFEYLATGNFILGIGPKNGDADMILQQTNTGKMFEFNEIDGIKKEIEKQYKNWQKGIKSKANKEEIQKYSRKELTNRLVSIYYQVLSQ